MATHRSTPNPAVLAAALLVAMLGASCGTAADPVASGAICAPATSDCPARTRLVRSADGRNLLDIAIHNRGPEAEVTFDVSFQGAGDAALDADGGAATDAGASAGSGIFPVRYQLSTGGRVTDRFPSTEVLSRSELFLRIDCAPQPNCDVRAEYVLSSQRSECESSGDCAGQKVCNTQSGLCVACLTDGDCQADQTCHAPTGRCIPPGDPGCTLSPNPGLPTGLAWLFALVLWGGLRARRSIRRHARRILALGGFVVIVAIPTAGDAAPPGSTFAIGTGPRWLVGPLAEDVKRGVGAELRQTVRWRHIGMTAWIETNYFVTTQQPPPLSKELQIFAFGLGPRAFYAVGPVEFAAGAGYQRTGFAPNALVRRTGKNANFNSIGGTLAAGYRWSQFVVRLGAQYQPLFGVDASLLSVNASFGISTR